MTKIAIARAGDIESWMMLVRKVSECFPGLETEKALEEHRNTVLDFMIRKGAICAKQEDRIVGALLFSKEHSMLCFLAVDPDFRRQHIGERMVSLMLSFMDAEKDVVVTTYREGVPEGKAARAFYKQLGFIEGKLTEEFGSPVQEFIWKPMEHNTERC